MRWRQYDNLFDDLKNAAYKACLAPIIRRINLARSLNERGILPRRIIICGSPRSGTTLMNELMKCYDAVYVMNREESALRFPYMVTGKKFVVTKHPLDFRRLDKIIAVFDEPFILFMLRDPRDVVVSRHYKQNNNYLVNFRVWLEAIQAYESLTYDKKILIRYEDLTNAPGTIQREIAERIGLSVNMNFKDFYKNVDATHQDIKSLGSIRPIDPKNSGKYLKREHANRIIEQLQKYPEFSECVIRYGYEKDRSWEAQIMDEDS